MQDSPPKPYIIIGSEDFTASIYKTAKESVEHQYRLSIVRLSAPTAFANQWLNAVDLIALLNLIRVLGSELISDGCLDTALHKKLGKIVLKLEQIFVEITPRDTSK